MQTNLLHRYPRTHWEAKKVISSFDVAWLEIINSPRGRERSRGFLRLIREVNWMIGESELRISKDLQGDVKMHKTFNTELKRWARKRRLPIKW